MFRVKCGYRPHVPVPSIGWRRLQCLFQNGSYRLNKASCHVLIENLATDRVSQCLCPAFQHTDQQWVGGVTTRSTETLFCQSQVAQVCKDGTRKDCQLCCQHPGTSPSVPREKKRGSSQLHSSVQPTNPDPGTASTTSVLNKQLAAPHHMQATKQSIHTNRMVKKCSSPEANANMTFSSQKLECLATNLLHHDPQNRIQKTNRNMAAIKGPRLYSKGLISSSIYGLTPTRLC